LPIPQRTMTSGSRMYYNKVDVSSKKPTIRHNAIHVITNIFVMTEQRFRHTLLSNRNVWMLPFGFVL